MSDLREMIEAAANTEVEAEASPVVESVVESEVEAAAPESEQVEAKEVESGESGEVPSIEEVAAKTAEKPEKAEKPTGDPRIDRAPQSWKGEAKRTWAELPLQARQEIVRRERDMMKVMNDSAQDRQRIQSVMEAVRPFQSHLEQNYGGNPVNALQSLLTVERALYGGTVQQKAELVANMVKQFGVDIRALDSALAGKPQAPEVRQQSEFEQLLDQRLQPMMSYLERQQQAEQQHVQSRQQQVNQTVEQMATDPNFPYFDEVRNDMADIVEMNAKRGVAISLEDAYARAVRMNDGTFQASNVRDNSQAATQAALTAHQEAQRAKGAAVSVSGSPTGTGRNAGNPSDLRGTILGALESTGQRL